MPERAFGWHRFCYPQARMDSGTRTRIAALLREAEQFLDAGTDHAAEGGRCRELISEMGRTIRQLIEISAELQRERDALASRLTRGSSVISTGKALMDVEPTSVDLREPETAAESDWDTGTSPGSGL